jgi:hypothetical protein
LLIQIEILNTKQPIRKNSGFFMNHPVITAMAISKTNITQLLASRNIATLDAARRLN